MTSLTRNDVVTTPVLLKKSNVKIFLLVVQPVPYTSWTSEVHLLVWRASYRWGKSGRGFWTLRPWKGTEKSSTKKRVESLRDQTSFVFYVLTVCLLNDPSSMNPTSLANIQCKTNWSTRQYDRIHVSCRERPLSNYHGFQEKNLRFTPRG